MSEYLVSAIVGILTPQNMIIMAMGTIFGIIGGATPGISGAMTMALFLPMSYGMTPVGALAMMLSLYIGAMSGGLISAILLKIPGTPASVATTFDGSPMAEKGQAGKALGIGILYSFIGGMLSIALLILVAPALAKVTLQFSYFEYFAVGIFALIILSAVGTASVIKSFIGLTIGIFLSFVGRGTVSPHPRFTMGLKRLDGGFDILIIMIGFYAVAQILDEGSLGGKAEAAKGEVIEFKIRGFGVSLREFKDQIGNCLWSAAIGAGIGILPGIGGGVSCLAAYGASKRRSKHPERYGTGIIDGVVASEAANNATVGGALIPLLTLGIPGDNSTAILLAAFIIHGITPGPLLFVNHGVVAYSVFVAAIIAHIMMILIEYFGIRVFIKILLVKRWILLPIVSILCIVGAFTVNNRLFDIWCMIGFGVFGFVLGKLKFSLATVILGRILGPVIEENFSRGMQRTQGDFLKFFSSPIAVVFFILSAVIIALSVRRAILNRKSDQVEV
jgi:putative tricarboxylic transport membrane protein